MASPSPGGWVGGLPPGGWARFHKRSQMARGLLRPGLEPAHWYFCHIPLVNACPTASLARFKGWGLDSVGGLVIANCEGHGGKRGGKLGPCGEIAHYTWYQSYRRIELH